ncbi:polymorphic outer membrane protein middle domain-containing protein, partial [Chlamydia psittaci]|uniref:polymorphic outer membrane protein middle domain-containing protein n=1 Tax=Chlamydia psittaci TaxID=83554 RepID=UPI0005174871
WGGGGGVAPDPAKVTSQTSNKTVTISAVNLVDTDGNAYEYPILATSQPFTAIVATTNTSTVTAPTTNLENYTPPTHYGYQGNWTVTWNNETTKQTATLT